MNLLLCFLESDFYPGGYAWPVWSLYINGERVARSAGAGGAGTADEPWAIGARASEDGTYPSKQHFDGLIDDACIYDVPLREYDVKPLHRESLPPSRANLRPCRPTWNLVRTIPVLLIRKTRIDYEVGAILHKLERQG
jgi:hypothetical protein